MEGPEEEVVVLEDESGEDVASTSKGRRPPSRPTSVHESPKSSRITQKEIPELKQTLFQVIKKTTLILIP